MRALLACLACLLLAIPVAAQAEPADIDAAARGVVRVVLVEQSGDEMLPVIHGTGFAVSSDMIVTNAPGPQHRMYWAEGELFEMYPVPALLPGQGLAVALTSYDGMVYAGFTSDRSVVPDVDEIGELITASIEELEDTEPYRARSSHAEANK